MEAHKISLVTDARSAASEGRAAGAVFSTSVSWIGKRVAKDDLDGYLCDSLLSGVSRRVIAERYNMSRNTVNAIRQVMDSRRELEPLKKEIARRLDRCVIYSLENLEEALSNGDIDAGSLPVATATLLDKNAALEGQPTARIEHVSTRKVTAKFLDARLDSLTSPNLANTPDSASGVGAILPWVQIPPLPPIILRDNSELLRRLDHVGGGKCEAAQDARDIHQ